MGDIAERRRSRRERLFRRVNEAIGRGLWPGDEHDRAAFRCECANRYCNRMVELTPAEYERVRANPRHFVVIPGHEHSQLETVIRRTPGYVVVEKLGTADISAEATEPRA
jgi:hypothetical protein